MRTPLGSPPPRAPCDPDRPVPAAGKHLSELARTGTFLPSGTASSRSGVLWIVIHLRGIRKWPKKHF